MVGRKSLTAAAAALVVANPFFAGPFFAGPVVADDPSTPVGQPAPLAALTAAMCPVLAEQAGVEALEAAIASQGWETLAALSQATCSYVFVDAGRAAPAGHHIVARYRNRPLIAWIGERFGAEGAAAVFLRQGPSGDARDYLDAMIGFFGESDPEIAALFQLAQDDLTAALSAGPSVEGEENK